MQKYLIRMAQSGDAAALAEIYRPFVETTDISFEYAAPTPEEFAGRICGISKDYPYLVCEADGIIIGYAYAHRYLERPAYQWDVETTIYFAPEGQGKGVGRVLYTALENILRLQNIHTLYACITSSNARSLAMHEALGYQTLAVFLKAGYKNKWLDIVWMQKNILACSSAPQPFLEMTKIAPQFIEKELERANAILAKL